MSEIVEAAVLTTPTVPTTSSAHDFTDSSWSVRGVDSAGRLRFGLHPCRPDLSVEAIPGSQSRPVRRKLVSVVFDKFKQRFDFVEAWPLGDFTGVSIPLDVSRVR